MIIDAEILADLMAARLGEGRATVCARNASSSAIRSRRATCELCPYYRTTEDKNGNEVPADRPCAVMPGLPRGGCGTRRLTDSWAIRLVNGARPGEGCWWQE